MPVDTQPPACLLVILPMNQFFRGLTLGYEYLSIKTTVAIVRYYIIITIKAAGNRSI